MPQTTACPKCATPLPERARFCPGCGSTTPTGFTPVDSERSSTPTQGAELAARRIEIQRALGAAWDVRSLIGQGGFGEVWAAFDTKLKRDVAVKTLRSDLVASHAMLTRFQREAESVARLRHPHIIPIYQVGEAEGLAFFVMPLVQGSSLQAVLSREGKLGIDESRRIISEAASALDAAHQAGIVHRDIKPENIMLDGDERRVLLMDFGIARAVGSDEEGRLTGTGLVIGTPQYMSPEQASADKQIDHRSDIYSLGVVAFQMLAGRHLFDTAAARSLVMHHIATEPPDIRSLRSEVPDDVADAIATCLKKAPADRWTSAGKLSKAMRPTAATASTGSSILRRLRPYSRQARVRSIAYLVTFGVILGASSFFQPSLLKDTWRSWFGGVRTDVLFEPRPGTPAQQFREIFAYQSSSRYRSREVQLAPLSDTLLLASTPAGGPMIYNGSTWRGIDVPVDNWVFPPVEWQGRLFIAGASAIAGSVLYEVTASGTVPRDTLPVRAASIWSDGQTILVGSTEGAILRGRPGQWRREPTGLTRAVTAVWGDAKQQFAIESRGLLLFNGLNWRKTDLRRDTVSRMELDAGAVLKDGQSIVVGASCDGPCRAEVFVRDKVSGRWARNPKGVPFNIALYGVWGTSASDYYAYGAPSEPACADGMCIINVKGDSARPVSAIRGDFHVIGVAPLRGVPHVLTSSGALWTVRNGEWGVVSEIPASLIRGVAVGSGFNIAWGHGIKVQSRFRGPTPRQRSDVRDLVIALDTALRTETVWILDERGGLSSITCRTAAGECAGERTVSLPDDRRALDLEPGPDGRLWIGGERGLLASRRGDQWTLLQVPRETDADESVVSVSQRDKRPGVAMTTSRVLSINPRGAVTPWRELGPSLGRSKKIVGMPGGGVVVLADAGAFSYAEDGQSRELRATQGTPTSIDVLDDGRIVVGHARADDPLVGGGLAIFRVIYSGLPPAGRQVPIPQSMDVFALGVGATHLHVAGSGGFWIAAPFNKLPALK